jgi:hypothetical protein
MEHLELTQLMFVTGFIRMRRNPDARIPREKTRHSEAEVVGSREGGRNMCKVQIFRREAHLGLYYQLCGL